MAAAVPSLSFSTLTNKMDGLAITTVAHTVTFRAETPQLGGGRIERDKTPRPSMGDSKRKEDGKTNKKPLVSGAAATAAERATQTFAACQSIAALGKPEKKLLLQARAPELQKIDAIIKSHTEFLFVAGEQRDSFLRKIERFQKDTLLFEVRRADIGATKEEKACMQKLAFYVDSHANSLAPKEALPFEERARYKAAVRAAAILMLKPQITQITAEIKAASPAQFADLVSDYKQSITLRNSLNDALEALDALKEPEQRRCLYEMMSDFPVTVEPEDATIALFKELKALLDVKAPAPVAVCEALLDGFQCEIHAFLKSEDGKVVPVLPQVVDEVERVLSHYVPDYTAAGEKHTALIQKAHAASASIEVFEIHQVDMGESDEINSCAEAIAFRIEKALKVGEHKPPAERAQMQAATRAVARSMLLPDPQAPLDKKQLICIAKAVAKTLADRNKQALAHLVANYRANKALRDTMFKAYNSIKRLPEPQSQLLADLSSEKQIDAAKLEANTVKVKDAIEQLLKKKPLNPLQLDIREGFRYSVRWLLGIK